jgi:hypothetical protein
MSKRAVKHFPLECMDAVEPDVTGSAQRSPSASARGDAGGTFLLSPECASRVSMHSNHHLTA